MTEEMDLRYYTTQNKKTVILTRQFRLPTYLNGNKTGMMIEVCAGMLDQDNPEQCIIRETEEETGYRLTTVHKVMETYIPWRRN
jgi:8-oxo-dGTP pyrophosphatase MutT (NUDIX family)